jgi:hypothetical protein
MTTAAGDYYFMLDCLDERCAIARRVREFAEKELAPVITDFWPGTSSRVR